MRKALLIWLPSRRNNNEIRITPSNHVYCTRSFDAIIRKFCEGKPHIILTEVEDSYERSIESFDRSLDMLKDI